MIEQFDVKLKLTGGPALLLHTVDGHEGLSSLYCYNVVALAEKTVEVDFEKLLGAAADIEVYGPGNALIRAYNGIVASIAYEGLVGDALAYKFEIVPKLWLAARTTNVRIFQHKSVKEIIKAVLEPHGIVVKDSTTAQYRPRDFCVQYRETDFAFVSRLMEHEGIFYFFRHAPEQHHMVLGDSPQVHVNEHGLQEMRFEGNARGRTQGAELLQWRWSSQIRTGKVSVRDHNFIVPGESYNANKEVQHKHPFAKLEAYDYPAGFPWPSGEPNEQAPLLTMTQAIVARRLESLQALRQSCEGLTTAKTMTPGARFKVAAHPVSKQNGEFVVHSTRTRIRIAGHESGAHEPSTHECEFIAFPSPLPFRPPQTTPKPRVYGPQTAVVVGPDGEEIYTDKYGRVKVQFHWDRVGEKNANSSCFVRVAQPSAGKQWGVLMLPRIGHEVVVEFIEGDPDRPLITGGVYNAENMPPLALPANQTVSTIRTKSSKGGGAQDFNELRFQDKKDSEFFYLQAQKDFVQLVKNEARVQVNADMHHTVKKDRKEKVEGSYELSVTKDLKHKVTGKYNLKVVDAMKLDTAKGFSLKSKEAMTSESEDTLSLKSKLDMHVKAGMNAGVEASTNLYLKGGVNVVIEAGTQLTIKAGASSIVLGPDGVSITGTMVKMNSGGAAGSGNAPKPVAVQAPEEPNQDPKAGQEPPSA